MGGLGLEECYKVFAPGYEVATLCSTHRTFQVSNADLVKAYPSSLSVLSALRKIGMRTAAVTSRRTTALRTLEVTGLIDLLDVVVTGDDVVNCKPDPEGLVIALDLLGATPDRSIMVGDTASDVMAAKSAGLRSVGVTFGFYSAADYKACPPDYVIDDLSELPALVEHLR